MIAHNCGFVVSCSLSSIYEYLLRLQHRGREAAGIGAIGKRIDVIKWRGEVSRFELTDLYKIFPPTNYSIYFGHVRYATRGKKDEILKDAHPHTIGGIKEDRRSHIFIRDCDAICVHNGQVDEKYLKCVEKTLLKTGCDTEALLHFYKKFNEEKLMYKIPGAYVVAIADKERKDVIIMRDRFGLKPAVLGIRDGKACAASEDVIFKSGGKSIENIESGSIYYISLDGSYKKKKILEPIPKHCFFELNYLADRDSTIDETHVRTLRQRLGKALADEHNPADAEIITFLPRCPETAAIAYANATKKPLNYIFYKLRRERAFMGSTPEERKESIKENLFISPQAKDIIKNKTIVVIDDSIVRGTNVRYATKLLKSAGAKKIYHLNYTPPIGIIGKDGKPRGCMFGVDMPPNDNFIARDRTIEEISRELGVEVRYLSTKRMLEEFGKLGLPPHHLCTYCIGGKHPFET